MSMSINKVNPRKTFAIISHPDAGKTTLTEKLLLFGGAIQQAGAVKARGENRRAHSDWMKVEQERGISVASSVMTFDYNNILDLYQMMLKKVVLLLFLLYPLMFQELHLIDWYHLDFLLLL